MKELARYRGAGVMYGHYPSLPHGTFLLLIFIMATAPKAIKEFIFPMYEPSRSCRLPVSIRPISLAE